MNETIDPSLAQCVEVLLLDAKQLEDDITKLAARVQDIEFGALRAVQAAGHQHEVAKYLRILRGLLEDHDGE